MNHPPHRPRVPSFLWAVLGAATALFPGTARADTPCTKDSDCLKGYVCESGTFSACPDIACNPDDPNCKLPECTPQAYSACVPGPCSTDSDCGTGMACVAAPVNCTTPAVAPCAPGEECDPAPAVDASCDPGTARQCAPRYTLPCHVDSDCGDGFTCVPDESCGSPGYDPSSGQAPPDAGITCVTASTSHCALKDILCSTDKDCPVTWQCVAPPSAASCGQSSEPGSTPSCSTSPSGPSQCVPPSYGGGGFSDGEGSSAPLASGSSQDDGTTSTAGGASRGTGAPTSSSGGCQMGGGPAGSRAAAWAALFGLAALVRRRRSA